MKEARERALSSLSGAPPFKCELEAHLHSCQPLPTPTPTPNPTPRYCGFEVTTEGDSFTIAFHDAFDAVSWALAMQQVGGLRFRGWGLW